MDRRGAVANLGKALLGTPILLAAGPAFLDEPKEEDVTPHDEPYVPAPDTPYVVEWIDLDEMLPDSQMDVIVDGIAKILDGPGIINPDAAFSAFGYQFRLKPVRLVPKSQYEEIAAKTPNQRHTIVVG